MHDVGCKHAFGENIEDLEIERLRELVVKIKSNLEKYLNKAEFKDLKIIYEAHEEKLSKIITLDDDSISEDDATDSTRDERISP